MLLRHLVTPRSQVKTKTVYDLKDQIKLAADRLRFLMQFASLSDEDVKLNTTTLKWPSKMEPMFDVTQRRLDEHKNASQTALTKRVEDFEALLEAYDAQISSFQNKQVQLQILC